ncbi:hypothetical protein BV898_09746 [Hypsibius exemplaris]|uniref:Uncharacterized protein n=1 Tax=Hypsibius exemplaris TaxID=2072580 RepID=A0A1W0WLM2_HYPEX|nr:hypothetical protein BV898_09746 [Hypsibius exemplaris]
MVLYHAGHRTAPLLYSEARLVSLQVETRTPDGRAREQDAFLSRLNPKFSLLSLVIAKLVRVWGSDFLGFQNIFKNTPSRYYDSLAEQQCYGSPTKSFNPGGSSPTWHQPLRRSSSFTFFVHCITIDLYTCLVRIPALAIPHRGLLLCKQYSFKWG